MSDFIFTLAILAGINVILASGFNLILGYGGLVSVAHPIFYAIGGYVSGLLAQKAGVPIPFAILSGVVVATVVSLFVSLPSLRVSGDYLVIATLGFQLGLQHIMNNMALTGAANGLTDIPSLIEGRHRLVYLAILIWVCAAFTVLIVRWLVAGDYGRAITAMRNDEDAFSALGRDATRIKVALIAIGSGLAGLAGGLYAHYALYLVPDQFGIFASATLLTMVVIGGAATIQGPIFGAIVVTLLPEMIRFIDLPIVVMAPLQGVIFTVLVMLFLIFRPQGLLGSRHGGLDAWGRAAETLDTERRAP